MSGLTATNHIKKAFTALGGGIFYAVLGVLYIIALPVIFIAGWISCFSKEKGKEDIHAGIYG